jgi:hypothetical protein
MVCCCQPFVAGGGCPCTCLGCCSPLLLFSAHALCCVNVMSWLFGLCVLSPLSSHLGDRTGAYIVAAVAVCGSWGVASSRRKCYQWLLLLLLAEHNQGAGGSSRT